jgi:hypothetical protein
MAMMTQQILAGLLPAVLLSPQRLRGKPKMPITRRWNKYNMR